MTSRAVFLGAALLAACAPSARFTGTALPIGNFELVPDRCFWTTYEDAGHVMRGLELTSEASPGLMVLVVEEPGTGAAILETERAGMVGAFRIGPGEGPPVFGIAASDCEVFQLGTALRPHLGHYDTRVDLEVRCAHPEGGTVTGSAHFLGYCYEP